MTEPGSKELAGSVKLYQCHLIVCTGHTEWPARPEEDGGFVEQLVTAVGERAQDLDRIVKITACDEPGLAGGIDILVFPDQIRFVGLSAADLPKLVTEYLLHHRIPDELIHVPITTHYVFICVHGQRDARCGLCGPPLVARFQTQIQEWGLAEVVTVRRSSHVGGHMFAGNVLIYPPGDWYGLVQPTDIPRLIEQHFIANETVTDLWRGRMGMTPQEQLRTRNS